MLRNLMKTVVLAGSTVKSSANVALVELLTVGPALHLIFFFLSIEASKNIIRPLHTTLPPS
jgi:hypothetical protein